MKNKQKWIDIICFVIAPAILAGLISDLLFHDEIKHFLGTIAVALIMFGIVRGKWRREDNKK